MALLPVFPIRLVLLFVPIAIAVGVLGFASVKGGNLLRKQGVAWVLTIVMVFAAIGIGYDKSPLNQPVREPDYPGTPAPAAADSFVWDFADVLSTETVQLLDKRNQRLWDRYQVTIGVVTCNYGGDDLGSYAMDAAEEMGLGGYDMIVVLDISGDNYWLVQGYDISRDFTDNDCSNYANEYLEYWFARGFYGEAVMNLTEALEVWYGNYFN